MTVYWYNELPIIPLKTFNKGEQFIGLLKDKKDYFSKKVDNTIALPDIKNSKRGISVDFTCSIEQLLYFPYHFSTHFPDYTPENPVIGKIVIKSIVPEYDYIEISNPEYTIVCSKFIDYEEFKLYSGITEDTCEIFDLVTINYYHMFKKLYQFTVNRYRKQ